MPIVQSFGALQTLHSAPTFDFSNSNIHLYDSATNVADLYASQPNVRICVDFLGRNLGQLALHAFRRVSDTDRVRLPTHDLVRWLGAPNPATRGYRLIENLIIDLALYFNAYLLKVRHQGADGRPAIGLVRLPPEQMHVEGGLLPSHFVWTANGRRATFDPVDVVYFNGYNPKHPRMGLSPLETLRQILAEESAAGAHRQSFWRGAARFEGVIEQAKDGPDWKKPQQDEFRQQWQEYAQGGAKAGMTAVLPRGMTYKEASFSARDSEYTIGGKLRREVCAAMWHIPQPMVGILDHATFSNVKEQHKHLYQDTLGPWCEMVQQEFEGQLLTECDDQDAVYIEFNIGDKLKGSFEEQATSLSMLVGRPIMTANEGRARLNLPALDDPSANELAPQQGGPAFSGPGGAVDIDTIDALDVPTVLAAAHLRHAARLQKAPAEARAEVFTLLRGRWTRELTADLAPLVGVDEAARLAAHTITQRHRRLVADVDA